MPKKHILISMVITMIAVIICGSVVLTVPVQKVYAAATYYVSPTGNDSNPGTSGSPWKTITKAANTLNAGDTVIVRAGLYRESVVPARGGTSDTNRISYIAQSGEEVIV